MHLASATLMLEILGIVFLLIAGLYLYYKFYVFEFWRKRDVFYLEPTFLTGNMMPLITGKTSQAEFFRRAYEHFKDHRFVGIYMLHKPYLVVNDLDLIRDVLTRKFANFHDRGMYCNEKVDPLTGHLFLLPGKKWRNLRVQLTPTFTSGKMKQMFPILKETGDLFTKFLNDKAQSREIIDVKDIFARYSTDIIMSVAFGITCDSLNHPNNEFRYWGKKVFEPKHFWNALMLWAPQVLDLLSLPYNERDLTSFFMNMFEDTVKYRESKNIVRKDFLNLLMQLMKDGYVDADDNTKKSEDRKIAEHKLTMAEAAAQAYVFYLAGFETSATTVTFCLYELAKHQDIQDKVRNEIHTVIQKHGELTYNAVSDMTYLHKVISETMRKYPPVPILNRISTKETQLEGTNLRIPVGIPVVIPVLGIHLDSNIYPDPQKFDPERFSEENIKARHPYAYLPFGEGPRICIGLRFGLLQTKIAIVSALMKNRLSPTPKTPDPIKYQSGSFVLVAEGGIHLRIEPV
ncbi:putative cytochrome P450 6a13 [Calliopsis andreniformis]|uniref:putative cytochrome P450 6a13 n=1 Tax=Calliopsis andreniformis TaxID=337506 RepID=UPI003FCC56F4